MARPRYKALEELSRSQVERLLYEANLGIEDHKLAARYYIDRLPQVDVAMEMGLDRKTVGARLRRIEQRLQRAQTPHKEGQEPTQQAPDGGKIK